MKILIVGAAFFVGACAVLLGTIFVTYLIGAWLAHSRPRGRRKK